MTIGTRLYTLFNGELVGTDEFGNRYYRHKKAMLHGDERRWVFYKGARDPSTVPAEWHAWLHHTTKTPLTENAAQAESWQKPHQANLTGSSGAYRPKGHDLKGGRRAVSGGDYQPWVPTL